MSICCLSRFCVWKNSKCLKRFPSVRMPGEEFTKENIFDLEEKGARRLKEEMAEKSICPRKNTCLLFDSELLLLSTSTKKNNVSTVKFWSVGLISNTPQGLSYCLILCLYKHAALLTSATGESPSRPTSLTAQHSTAPTQMSSSCPPS